MLYVKASSDVAQSDAEAPAIVSDDGYVPFSIKFKRVATGDAGFSTDATEILDATRNVAVAATTLDYTAPGGSTTDKWQDTVTEEAPTDSNFGAIKFPTATHESEADITNEEKATGTNAKRSAVVFAKAPKVLDANTYGIWVTRKSDSVKFFYPGLGTVAKDGYWAIALVTDGTDDGDKALKGEYTYEVIIGTNEAGAEIEGFEKTEATSLTVTSAN